MGHGPCGVRGETLPTHDRVVLDWGFPVSCLPWVEQLREKGVRLVWFDGDAERARLAFEWRGGIPVQCSDEQVKAIRQAGYPRSLRCLVIPALSVTGVFLERHEIESMIFPSPCTTQASNPRRDLV
jgi:hypothetical protein